MLAVGGYAGQALHAGPSALAPRNQCRPSRPRKQVSGLAGRLLWLSERRIACNGAICGERGGACGTVATPMSVASAPCVGVAGDGAQ